MLASNIVDFYAFIGFIIVILVFSLLFGMGKEKIQFIVDSEAGYSESGMVLLNILRTPIKPNQNVADLLVQAASDNDFDEFTDRAKPTLDDFMSADRRLCCWELQVKKGSSTLHSFGGGFCGGAEFDIVSSSVFIPVASGKTPLEAALLMYLPLEGWDDVRACTDVYG